MFDWVYFSEINAGNGEYEHPPSRELFIKKGTNWLIVHEDADFTNSDFTHSLQECVPLEYNSDSTKDKLKCVEKITREYRSESENDAWINRMLSYISINEQ